MVVIELNPGSSFNESASLQIPEGQNFELGFFSTNIDPASKSFQGVKLQYGTNIYRITEQDSADLNNPIPDSVLVSNAAGFGKFLGPASISVFASNAVSRLQVWIKNNDGICGILNNTQTNCIVSVPANSILSMGYVNSVFYSRANFITPEGNKFLNGKNGNYYYTQPRFGGGSSIWSAAYATSQINSTFQYSTINNFITPGRDFAGPCTVEIVKDSYNTNNLAFYSYKIFNANFSLNKVTGNTALNNNNNSNNNAVANIIMERSSDLVNWVPVETYVINETSGRAFYRLKISQ